jgi:hypothetical protein
MKVKVVWSLAALNHAFQRLGWRMVRESESGAIEYRRHGFHAFVKWRKNLIQPCPPFFLEIDVHFDPVEHYGLSSGPRAGPIYFGEMLEREFNHLSLKYSQVLLEWADDDSSVQKQALLRISREDMEPCRV